MAVANAAPEVLDAADEVTAANTEDGVARLLERILARTAPAANGPRRPGPSRVSSFRRSLASATVGMVPAGTHHRAR